MSRELYTLTARDVMTAPVVYVMEETPVREIARVLLEHGISAAPVRGGAGQLIGMVSEGDLVARETRKGEKRRSWWLDMLERTSLESLKSEGQGLRNYVEYHGLRAKDVMSSNVVTVDASEPIPNIAALLRANGIKRVPVVSRGEMIGIVSRADLLAALANFRG